MKVAYVIYPGACFMGEGDGQKMQAVIWKNALNEEGIEADFINPWKGYDWKHYDIIHVFGFGLWNYDFIHWGSRINPNFVFSPIIDTNTPMWKYRLATYCGNRHLRLYSQNYMLRILKKDIKLFFARTDYEAGYLRKGYGIEERKIALVPLSYRFNHYRNMQKENFCLFVGTMTQERKNVGALIKAAQKYGFNLVLAGNTGNDEAYSTLKKLIGNHKNIEVKGFVSEKELIDLYNRAKVFALPSLNEGVGLVALEAAVHGCNIVITELGGPKEYYNNLAYTINPYNVDDIGLSIKSALENNDSQPQLREHIIDNYSPEQCIQRLIKSYRQLLTQEGRIK